MLPCLSAGGSERYPPLGEVPAVHIIQVVPISPGPGLGRASLPRVWYSASEPPSFWNREGKFYSSGCLRVVLLRGGGGPASLPSCWFFFSFLSLLQAWHMVSLWGSGEGRCSLGPGHVLVILSEQFFLFTSVCSDCHPVHPPGWT